MYCLLSDDETWKIEQSHNAERNAQLVKPLLDSNKDACFFSHGLILHKKRKNGERRTKMIGLQTILSADFASFDKLEKCPFLRPLILITRTKKGGLLAFLLYFWVEGWKKRLRVVPFSFAVIHKKEWNEEEWVQIRWCDIEFMPQEGKGIEKLNSLLREYMDNSFYPPSHPKYKAFTFTLNQ